MSKGPMYRFYHSMAWRRAAAAVRERQHGLCAGCLSHGYITPIEIVHHKVHLNPENVNDPDITLNPERLVGLCRQCHALEHPEVYGHATWHPPLSVSFDEDGNVMQS